MLGREAADRHDCANAALQMIDLRSGRSRHSSALACDALPYTPAPLVVTLSGAPAWILDRADASRLLAIAAGRGLIELDSGSTGSLHDLRAEADTVHWTHAGEPRAADLQ